MINVMKERVKSFSRRNRLPNCDLIRRKKTKRHKDGPLLQLHPRENQLAEGGRRRGGRAEGMAEVRDEKS